jgi:hypothetical protein
MGTAEMTPKFTQVGINVRAKRERQMWVGIIEIVQAVNLIVENALLRSGE